MDTKFSAKPSGPLAPQYVNFVYLPSAVLIAGAAFIRLSLLPVAVAIAAALGGYQFYANQHKKVLDPNKFQEFPIGEIKRTSHNTAIYRFTLPSSNSILGLPIGQHISLAANLDVTDQKTGNVEKNKEVVRSYTPISSDVHPGYFDLMIKSYPTGNISRHLGTLKVGDTMKVKGPKGAMVYTPNMVRSFGMIAGGTGITPMLQIVRAILRGRSKGDKTEVNLIFANVDEKDILLREEIDDLKKGSGFSVYYVLNNPPEKWDGGVGFVTADMIKAHCPAPAKDMKILICGPPPMVSALKKATESLGYEKARAVSRLGDQVFCF